jgi:hypothetical protein
MDWEKLFEMIHAYAYAYAYAYASQERYASRHLSNINNLPWVLLRNTVEEVLEHMLVQLQDGFEESWRSKG